MNKLRTVQISSNSSSNRSMLSRSSTSSSASSSDDEDNENNEKNRKRRTFDKGCSFVYGGQHAEVAVIQKFIERYPKKMLSECVMLVIRINNGGKTVNSKPCKNCQNYIVRYNVGKVYYSV